MAQFTRRGFIKNTSAGAATVGALATMPGLVSAHGLTGTHSADLAGAEPILAHIGDAASGTITLLVGTREIIVHDTDLVARLVRAAR